MGIRFENKPETLEKLRFIEQMQSYSSSFEFQVESVLKSERFTF